MKFCPDAGITLCFISCRVCCEWLPSKCCPLCMHKHGRRASETPTSTAHSQTVPTVRAATGADTYRITRSGCARPTGDSWQKTRKSSPKQSFISIDWRRAFSLASPLSPPRCLPPLLQIRAAQRLCPGWLLLGCLSLRSDSALVVGSSWVGQQLDHPEIHRLTGVQVGAGLSHHLGFMNKTHLPVGDRTTAREHAPTTPQRRLTTWCFTYANRPPALTARPDYLCCD